MIARLDRWLLSDAPAERLAALRILTGGFVLAYLVSFVGEFARVTRLPDEQFDPIGIATVLDRPVGRTAVWVIFGLSLGSGVAFVLGARFRLSGPVFALTTLAWATYHSSWGQMLHFQHLFALHLLVIGFSPAADAWSLDERRNRRSPIDPGVRYGWPVRLAAIVTTVTYSIAAITKLRVSGLEWLNSSTLGNHIAYSAVRMDLLGAPRPPLAAWVVRNSWLISPMAVSAVLIELLAPLALFNTRIRNGWAVSALLLHAGTAATMMVWFSYHGLGFALLPLFPAERIIRAITRPFSGFERARVSAVGS